MGPPTNAFDLPLFVRALEFAARKHSTQRRKDADASPYINHPIAVVSILALEAGIHDEGVLCAALLHDTIEDTETTEQELIAAFGAEIAAIVAEVTDDKALAKEERKLLQVKHAKHLSPAARLVKVADKIANLLDVADCPPADWSLARRQEYFDWAKAVIDALPDVPTNLRTIFDAAYASKPTRSVGEIWSAAGSKETHPTGTGFVIGGVRPPKL